MVVPVFMGFGALIFPSSEPFSSTIFLNEEGGDLSIYEIARIHAGHVRTYL